MANKRVLPKRVLHYVHETGVRAIDALADRSSSTTPGGPKTVMAAMQTLASHWNGMTVADKEQFVERVTTSVVDVVAATATFPLGRKLGFKAFKVASKAIRKQRKRQKKEKAAASRNAAASVPVEVVASAAKPKKKKA